MTPVKNWTALRTSGVARKMESTAASAMRITRDLMLSPLVRSNMTTDIVTTNGTTAITITRCWIEVYYIPPSFYFPISLFPSPCSTLSTFFSPPLFLRLCGVLFQQHRHHVSVSLPAVWRRLLCCRPPPQRPQLQRHTPRWQSGVPLRQWESHLWNHSKGTTASPPKIYKISYSLEYYCLEVLIFEQSQNTWQKMTKPPTV